MSVLSLNVVGRSPSRLTGPQPPLKRLRYSGSDSLSAVPALSRCALGLSTDACLLNNVFL